MAETKIGKVTHFYDKLGVAIVALDGGLAVGDRIKFMRGGEDLFEQQVDSMQYEHAPIESASAGQEIGLKTEQPVKDSAEVYKVE